MATARLAGRFDVLPMASQADATIDLMLSEAINTSAIEDEHLDRESVRSSLLSLEELAMLMATKPRNLKPKYNLCKESPPSDDFLL